MIVIDADLVARGMPPRSLIEALRTGHRSGAIGAVERLLLQPPDGANAALIWAAWDTGRGIAVKTATVFPGNSGAGGLPNVETLVTLFDGADGRPLAAIHGVSFIQVKTAADSAHAADIVARPEAGVLTITGEEARAAPHIRFHLAVRPSIRRVLAQNRTPNAAERLASSVSFPGIASSAAPDAEAAVARRTSWRA